MKIQNENSTMKMNIQNSSSTLQSHNTALPTRRRGVVEVGARRALGPPTNRTGAAPDARAAEALGGRGRCGPLLQVEAGADHVHPEALGLRAHLYRWVDFWILIRGF